MFPYKTTEECIGSVLCCINTEIKGLLLLCIDDHPSTRYHIADEINEIVKKAWTPSPQTVQVNCKYLENQLGITEENSGWQVTEFGENFLKPIAAYTLKLAVENKTSLFSILGKPNTSKRYKGPYDRYRILEKLKEGAMRTQDLSNKLELHKGNTGRHLRILGKSGFVDYDFVNLAKEPGFGKCEWIKESPKKIKPAGKRPILLRKVAEIIYKLKKTNRREVTEKLGYKDYGLISNIMKILKDQGFIKPIKFIGSKIQSEAKLTRKGKKFNEELFDKIKRCAIEKKPLEEMIQIQKKFEKDFKMLQCYASKALKLYSEVAPLLKRK